MVQQQPETRISGLEQLIKEAAARPDAPVERWDPPYCGDIGLAIRADGTWTYRDSPITRIPLVKLFARVLRRDADGKTFLVTPAEKIDITVADAPFLAVEMEIAGEDRDQQLTFRTNVDDVITAGPDHPLAFKTADGGGLKPYVRVRGRLDALVSRSVTYDLLELLQPGCENPEVLGIWSNGAFFTVPQG
ncbi:MAG: DUF1285 domain-containing protein [Hyphomicrobiaceae bacterium]|nr:DUF1285 domain-containing protein [Hyphomicrobiaceae bacterium]